MAGQILVAYGSRYGSTREVAESIAATLRARGLLVDVRAAAEVDDIAEYKGLVLGGGIYVGRWHRGARGFVKHFAHALEEIPVAVFALGPVDDDPEHVAGSEEQFRHAVAHLPVEPVAVKLFGGAVDPARLRFPFNHMPAADVRDWDAVRAWAEELADRFEKEPVPA